MKKRFLSGFLSVCMMAGLIAYPADVSIVRAEETEGVNEIQEINEIAEAEAELLNLEEQETVAVGTTSGDYTYQELEDGTVEITGYSGSDTELSIPDTIEGKSVTSIGDSAFYNCENLTSINIPEGVISIEDKAFYACYNLTDIDLPDSVEFIGNSVFENCNLTSIKIPDGVKFIGDCLFEGSGLTSIEIPASVTNIGQYAFFGCNLSNINLPNSVESIGEGAFEDCYSLTSIEIPSSVTSIGDYVFYGCSSLTSIEIPASVTSIGDYVFYGCSSLTSIEIPASVTSIGDYAFYGCSDAMTIYCHKDSYAHTYAVENSIPYKFLDSADNTTENIHTHQYTGKVTKEATCTEAGVRTYTCSCGDTCTEAIPETGHSYSTTTVQATISKKGSITKKCSVCGDTVSTITIYYPKTITLAKTSYAYNGKAQKPTVTVKDSNGKKLKKGTDYTVTYAKGCKNVGKYTVTIKFKGNYSGTVKKTFTITPKSTSLTKLTAKKKSFSAKWKKLTSQTTGYQIQYSTSSKFTKKTTKTVAVSKNKTTSKSISKLKAKKKYYVRIRTYKTVKVNGKSTKIYSNWSKTKTVATKL